MPTTCRTGSSLILPRPICASRSGTALPRQTRFRRSFFIRVPPESPTSPGTLPAASPPAKSLSFFHHSINPWTFLKRLGSWVALWIVALWFVFSGWNEGWLLLIAFFGLAGQWEFYRAQEEKRPQGLQAERTLLRRAYFRQLLVFPHPSLAGCALRPFRRGTGPGLCAAGSAHPARRRARGTQDAHRHRRPHPVGTVVCALSF